MELSDRKEKILDAIIRSYLETGRAGRFQNHFQEH